MSFEIQDFVKYSEYVSYAMYFYACIIIVPIGVTLNSITVYIFLREKFRKTNFGFISAILGCFDTLSLIWSYVVYKFLDMIGNDPNLESHGFCFLSRYIGRVIQQLPIYVQVIMSLNQYMEINLLNKKYRFDIKARKNITIAILFVFFLLLVINIPNMFKELKLDSTNVTNEFNKTVLKVVKTCKMPKHLVPVSDIEVALMRSIIPFFILTSLNFLIAKTLIDSKKKLLKNSKLKKELQFSLSLFLINLIFVLFNLPLSMTHILIAFYTNSNSNIMKLIQFIHLITNWIAYFYNSISFFVNISFNLVFRREFLALIGFKKYSNKNEQSKYTYY